MGISSALTHVGKRLSKVWMVNCISALSNGHKAGLYLLSISRVSEAGKYLEMKNNFDHNRYTTFTDRYWIFEQSHTKNQSILW